MNRISTPVVLAFLFGLAAMAVRFSSVPTNFALIGGLSLFCGCYLRGWKAWGIPLGFMAFSDIVGHFSHVSDMGFYHPATMAGVYLGFATMILVGHALRLAESKEDQQIGALWVIGGASLGSMAFFLLSNFGSWLDPQSGYALSFSGLVECYVAGLPFHKWTIASDLFSAALFFGTYQVFRGRLVTHPASSR